MRRLFAIASILLPAFATAPAAAEQTVVVTTRVVYPGQVVTADALQQVRYTNRPELLNSVAVLQGDAEGKVAQRTLLPGRLIPTASLREAHAVQAGKPVQVNFVQGTLTITLTAVPLQPGAPGDVVRVRNAESGVIFIGTVLADGTILVGAS